MIYIENDRKYIIEVTDLEEEILYLLKAIYSNCRYDQFININGTNYLCSSYYNVPFIKIEQDLLEYRNSLEAKVEENIKETMNPDTFFLPNDDEILIFDETELLQHEEYESLSKKHYDLALNAKTAKERNLNFKLHAKNAKLAKEHYERYIQSHFENDLYSLEEDCNLELQNPMFYLNMIGSNLNSKLFKKECKKRSKFNYKITQEALHSRKH